MLGSQIWPQALSHPGFFHLRHLLCWPIPPRYMPTADRAVKIRCFLLHRQAASPESSSVAVYGKLSLAANRRPPAWTRPRQLENWLQHFKILLTRLFMAVLALIVSGISLVLWPVKFDISFHSFCLIYKFVFIYLQGCGFSISCFYKSYSFIFQYFCVFKQILTVT